MLLTTEHQMSEMVFDGCCEQDRRWNADKPSATLDP